jgi:hypothetical protein
MISSHEDGVDIDSGETHRTGFKTDRLEGGDEALGHEALVVGLGCPERDDVQAVTVAAGRLPRRR